MHTSVKNTKKTLQKDPLYLFHELHLYHIDYICNVSTLADYQAGYPRLLFQHLLETMVLQQTPQRTQQILLIVHQLQLQVTMALQAHTVLME